MVKMQKLYKFILNGIIYVKYIRVCLTYSGHILNDTFFHCWYPQFFVIMITNNFKACLKLEKCFGKPMCQSDIFVSIFQICILNSERLSNLLTLTYLEKYKN